MTDCINNISYLTAIILAAGEGKRIGCPKCNLMINGKTFLSIIIEKIFSMGIKNIICVVKSNSFKLIQKNILVVANDCPNASMFSSIYYGIKASNMSSLGYLIYPVDHPFVQPNVINKLCTEFMNNSMKVICPTYQDKLGHPIIIPTNLAKKINKIEYFNGLRGFILDQGAIIHKVNTIDSGILKNINTKEDVLSSGVIL